MTVKKKSTKEKEPKEPKEPKEKEPKEPTVIDEKPKKTRVRNKTVSKPEEIVPIPVAPVNVILHLQCFLHDILTLQTTTSDPFFYNSTVPPEVISYNETLSNEYSSYDKENDEKEETPVQQCSFCSEKSDTNTKSKQNQKSDDAQDKEITAKLKKLKVMLHKSNNTIINGLKSSCFWCTCEFDGPACYIPKFEMNGSIYVYGCFCLPECASAFLWKESIDDSVKFERYHLLNKIYGPIYGLTTNIRLAPNPHYLLAKFFGTLTIQEYRALLVSNTISPLRLIEKPMTHILPELHDDTLNTSKTGVYKIKRESEREKGPSKTDIIRDKFGLSNAK